MICFFYLFFNPPPNCFLQACSNVWRVVASCSPLPFWDELALCMSSLNSKKKSFSHSTQIGNVLDTTDDSSTKISFNLSMDNILRVLSPISV